MRSALSRCASVSPALLLVVLTAACGAPPPAAPGAQAPGPADPFVPVDPYGGPQGGGTSPTPATERRCAGAVGERPAIRDRDARVELRTPDGRVRVASVHTPPGYDPKVPAMLVLNLHGLTSNGWQQDLLTTMKTRADRRNFLVVYPEGTSSALEFASWNAGVCCPPAVDKNIDDVGYLRLLLDRVQETHCIDAARVFATGMSNGGFLSHRLACELSDRIAAVAPVAGQMALPSCDPGRPVPVLHFHGEKDPLVPYKGGHPLNLNGFLDKLLFPSVETTISGWAQRNGCRGPRQVVRTLPDARCEAYSECAVQSPAQNGQAQRADVVLCTVPPGGHTWPGGSHIADLVLGYTASDLSASDLMLDFFAAHPMPPRL